MYSTPTESRTRESVRTLWSGSIQSWVNLMSIPRETSRSASRRAISWWRVATSVAPPVTPPAGASLPCSSRLSISPRRVSLPKFAPPSSPACVVRIPLARLSAPESSATRPAFRVEVHAQPARHEPSLRIDVGLGDLERGDPCSSRRGNIQPLETPVGADREARVRIGRKKVSPLPPVELTLWQDSLQVEAPEGIPQAPARTVEMALRAAVARANGESRFGAGTTASESDDGQQDRSQCGRQWSGPAPPTQEDHRSAPRLIHSRIVLI